MFSKFKIEGFSSRIFRDQEKADHFMGLGKAARIKNLNRFSSSLKKCIQPNGHIDAAKLSDDWFPIIDADVFISHSHKDEENALLLAGFLKECFGLKAFVDSTVWGNITELQEELDKLLYGDTTRSYNYDKHNKSTAYVHLLLSTALTKMLDKSEAIFFLSTPQSIQSLGIPTTSSAWIYHEVVTSGMLRQRYPIRTHRGQRCFASEGLVECRIQDGYTMDFKIDLSDFKTITPKIIHDWETERLSTIPHVHSLDILYHHLDNTPKKRLIYG